MSGGGTVTRRLVIKSVVGTVGTRYRGDTGGVLGGGGGNRLGGMGGRGGRGRDGEIRKNDTVEFNTIGTEPSAPISYDTGLEHHHMTMSKLGGHVGRLERVCV